jgi:ligand-binding sensor domain-containing protein
LPDQDDPDSLNSASIWALHIDVQGIVWVGTYDGGLNYAPPSMQQFEILRPRHDGLSDPHVGAILEDRAGNLWVGTDGGGLNRIDTKSGAFRSYHHDPDDPTTISGDHVFKIVRLHSNELLVTSDVGADLFDPETGRFARLTERYAQIESNYTFSAAEDAQGNLWLGATFLTHYVDHRADSVRTYSHDIADPQSLGRGLVSSIHIDREGSVWFGTEGGLSCLPAG